MILFFNCVTSMIVDDIFISYLVYIFCLEGSKERLPYCSINGGLKTNN